MRSPICTAFDGRRNSKKRTMPSTSCGFARPSLHFEGTGDFLSTNCRGNFQPQSELVPVLVTRLGSTCAQLFQSSGVRNTVLFPGDEHIEIVGRILPQASQSKPVRMSFAPNEILMELVRRTQEHMAEEGLVYKTMYRKCILQGFFAMKGRRCQFSINVSNTLCNHSSSRCSPTSVTGCSGYLT